MRGIDYFMIILAMFLYWGLNQYYRDKQYDELVIKLDSIQQSIDKRTKIDSLYWNHLEQCAFELREGIKYEK